MLLLMFILLLLVVGVHRVVANVVVGFHYVHLFFHVLPLMFIVL
jgi:hypothetical protein